MDQSKKVTVGIPVYNVEKYISRCLYSVLNQDYKNINILIVYDESHDNSLQIVKNIFQNTEADYNIIYKEPKDRGPGQSRNVILNNFDGDFLYFLDSDDFIEHDTIGLMVLEAIVSGSDIVASSHRLVNESNQELGSISYSCHAQMSGSEFRDYIYLYNGQYTNYVWNKLYKREFIKNNNLKFEEKLMEDMLFNFFTHHHLQKISLIPNITLNYLIRDSSITQSQINKNMSHELAEFILNIKETIFSFNTGHSYQEFCSNIDVFLWSYIHVNRDALNSDMISPENKSILSKKSFVTPNIPIAYYPRLYKLKKNKFLILLLVRVSSDLQNKILIKIYSIYKSFRKNINPRV